MTICRVIRSRDDNADSSTRRWRSGAAAIALAWVLFGAPACGAPASRFLGANARAHVTMLAGTIGSRPLGSDENRRAREYLVDQLSLYGFTVRLQQVEAVRPEVGLSARVSNIIAVRPGASPDAIGLLAHYDSSQHAPGAADDALGVAVCLEAGRVLAARRRSNRTLMILLTDGEETGLMGAAALTLDKDISNRLRAYVNVEAIGSGEPSLLFESGPGNQWLVKAWAQSAPRPRGSSYATEIYKRLPNDTDFTILKGLRIPGLNFAAVGNSFTYHTARDTPDRLSTATIRHLGDSVLEIADTLDRTDLNRDADDDPVFFDVVGRIGIVYSRRTARILAVVAVLLGFLAWLRLLRHTLAADGGVRRFIMTAFWALLGTLSVLSTFWLATWAVRTAREVYHPWYGHPRRLQLLLVLAGLVVGRMLLHGGRRLPARFHGSASSAMLWSIALPVWLVLGTVTARVAPAAAYFWIIPLVSAAVILLLLPLAPQIVARASIAILMITAIIWIPEWWHLWMFVVAQMGRLPIVTPLLVYPLLVTAIALMLVPPAWACLGTVSEMRGARMSNSAITTSILLLLVVIAAGLAYSAPAYTSERPLRAQFRLVQHPDRARWEIGSTEPWLDFGSSPGAPRSWRPSTPSGQGRSPIAPLRQPFLFEAPAPQVALPAVIHGTATTVDGQIELQLAVTAPPSSTVTFVMPAGVTPDQPSLAGVISGGRWKAAFVAPVAEGVTFSARIPAIQARLDDAFVIVRTPRLPGGSGWQGLPSWLPVERVVWSADAVFVEPIDAHLEPATEPARTP